MESQEISFKGMQVILEEEEEENQGSTTTITTSSRCNFTELPWHVILEIMLKLPIEALIRCRYVCKAWHDLLLDPSFAKLHHGSTPTGVVLQSSLFPHGNSGPLYLLDPQEQQPSSIIAKFNQLPYLESTLVNSCNGLICSCDIRMANPIYISNPVTEIYTLGSGAWKRSEHVPPARHRSLFGTFVNGALHWLVKLPNGSLLIRSFDLENEKFQTIPLPSSTVFHASFKRSNLGILGDCLCLSSIVMSASSDWDIHDVWVMKEYGVRESWIKEVAIKYPSPWEFWWSPECVKPNGILLTHVNATAHASSFVSLKDIAMGDGSKVLKF
ncbi:hypothetical protein SLA2020_282120 [Shorea laevis]